MNRRRRKAIGEGRKIGLMERIM